MPRGGKRDKAGRPSTWASGCKFEDTKVIRVPKEIVDRLLEIAHKLDAKEPLELVTESKSPVSNEIKQLEILKDSLTTAIEVPIEFAEDIRRVIQRKQVNRKPSKSVGNNFGLVCPSCKSDAIRKHGKPKGKQAYQCKVCSHRFSETTAIKGL